METSSPRSGWHLSSEALPPLPDYSQREGSPQSVALASEPEPDPEPTSPEPSIATDTTPDSYFLTQSTRTPFGVGLPSDSPFASDDLEGDAMSETSTDTHIIVQHPDSDEEDSAERRWRLAEQRGNDIRRARSVPSPKFQGTSTYLKIIVVRLQLYIQPPRLVLNYH